MSGCGPPRQFEERRAGDALGDVAALLDRHPLVVDVVEDERGHADRRQHVTHVDEQVHVRERLLGAGARAVTEEVCEGGDLLLIRLRRAAPNHALDGSRLFALEPIRGDALACFRLRASPGIVGGPERTRTSSVQDERPCASRVRRCEQRAHRYALGPTHEGGALGSRRVHNRANVVHARLAVTRSDIPVPRLSKWMSRENEDSRS